MLVLRHRTVSPTFEKKAARGVSGDRVFKTVISVTAQQPLARAWTSSMTVVKRHAAAATRSKIEKQHPVMPCR
jgi:hypothetical protein